MGRWQPADPLMAQIPLGDQRSSGSSSAAWPSPQLQPQEVHLRGMPQEELVEDAEDAEEWAQQEQLAATLRCMGFDEEPGALKDAAQRAGGNLNVAVQNILNRGAG
ncbi:unnamed protein product [Polarella glacialis]|uniref:UBA domain-containing protein n=1 Tax=Polarella glacialis TaxID=89957 RepID=A0A813HM07_POLGL|nr:unnamed protein product [Polarella glacialis]